MTHLAESTEERIHQYTANSTVHFPLTSTLYRELVASKNQVGFGMFPVSQWAKSKHPQCCCVGAVVRLGEVVLGFH